MKFGEIALSLNALECKETQTYLNIWRPKYYTWPSDVTWTGKCDPAVPSVGWHTSCQEAAQYSG